MKKVENPYQEVFKDFSISENKKLQFDNLDQVLTNLSSLHEIMGKSFQDVVQSNYFTILIKITFLAFSYFLNFLESKPDRKCKRCSELEDKVDGIYKELKYTRKQYLNLKT